MKTLTDYHKKVLGISLKGRAPSPQQEKEPEQFAGLFCFLCHEDDFNQNKELVLKILGAAKVGLEIVVFDQEKAKAFEEVFTFGVHKEKALNFESFSVISKDPELKKKLWGELKKRS